MKKQHPEQPVCGCTGYGKRSEIRPLELLKRMVAELETGNQPSAAFHNPQEPSETKPEASL